MMGPAILDYTVNGNEWDAMGYREILGEPYAPYGCYPCYGEDNWIIIACAGDEEWQSMVNLIGKSSWAADAKFATKAGRKASIKKSLIENFPSGHANTRQNKFFVYSRKPGVAAGIPSSGEDLFHDIHLRARGHVVETEAQPWGKMMHHGLPGIPSFRPPTRRAQRPGSARTMIMCSARFWV